MKNLRSEVIKYAKMLNSRKLSALRSGNISTRFQDGFLITPSGAKYSSLKNKDIVFVTLKGKFDKKKGIPSSEWRFHQDIYLNKKEAKAIVHAHSNYATAISTHGKGIPAFHYMVAMAGGNDIKCAKYATYGTRVLSKNILKALRQRNACLIGNHGQIAFEENLPKDVVVNAIPLISSLNNPTIKEIAKAIDAKILFGHEYLNNQTNSFKVGAMQLRNYLKQLEQDCLIITPGDRADIILGALQANISSNYPSVSGIVLTGGLIPEEPIVKLIEGLQQIVPILSVKFGTFEVANKIGAVRSHMYAENKDKIIISITKRV